MPDHYDVAMNLDVRVPMRDGVTLSADLYLPKGRGPFPVVLTRTPYGNNMDSLIEKARRLANRGYAVVLQDTRGRWDSEGSYEPLRTDGEDGYDTQEWIGRQAWCNGKIGMAGGSYLGWVQWASAPHGSPYLTCMAPRVICTEWHAGLVYPGGAFHLNVAMTWGMRTNSRTGQTIEFHHWTEVFRGLPLKEIDELAGRRLPFLKDWLEHPSRDPYWDAIDVSARMEQIRAPAFNMGGWYDLYAQHTFENYNAIQSRGGTPA
ncbi:MAG: CocE/NonD family hydrolase, partial [Armatimonadetes bacterium]|nr:CocE/NonD family hydrolase [Armatimonadota bacterium]